MAESMARQFFQSESRPCPQVGLFESDLKGLRAYLAEIQRRIGGVVILFFLSMNPELEEKLVADYPSFFARSAKGDSRAYWSTMLDEPQHPDRRHNQFDELGISDVCWCDDGWYEIIHDFCHLTKWTLDAVRHVRTKEGKLTAHEAPKFEFVQIKEKMGTLCIYYKLCQSDAPVANTDPQDIQNRLLEITREIHGFKCFAYRLSSRTCELTGSAGRLQINGGWLKTLSREKALELGFEDPPAELRFLSE